MSGNKTEINFSAVMPTDPDGSPLTAQDARSLNAIDATFEGRLTISGGLPKVGSIIELELPNGSNEATNFGEYFVVTRRVSRGKPPHLLLAPAHLVPLRF